MTDYNLNDYPLEHKTGLLNYRVRPSKTQSSKGILFLLHGFGGNAQMFLGAFATLLPELTIVFLQAPFMVAPEQFAWYQSYSGPTEERINEDYEKQSRSLLTTTIKTLQKKYNASPAQTIITGFSQGAAMSSNLALTEPALVQGLGMLSGRLLPATKSSYANKTDLHHLHAFIAHGTNDHVIPSSYANMTAEEFKRLDIPYELRFYEMDHTVILPELNDLATWITKLLKL